MSTEELISPCGTVASDARTAGRTLLEYPIPFDAKLSNDMRFFLAGDFKTRTGSAPPMGALRVPVTGADALRRGCQRGSEGVRNIYSAS